MTSKRQRVTMMDVAREAGCSQSTVSLVLNGVPDVRISEETQRRVWDAARKLRYLIVPRSARKSPGGNGVIGFVVDRLSTSPEAVVSADGAREAGWENDVSVLVAHTLNDEEMERRAFSLFNSMPLVGLIFASIMTREIKMPPFLENVPSVLLNCYSQERRLPSVVPGEVAGGHLATARLLAAGHRRIGFINGEEWMDASEDRFKGYRQALSSADIPYDPALYRAGDWQLRSGYLHTKSLLELNDPPTAIFCANDRMAVGCYMALTEMGKRIPDDIAVMGYDDEEVARHLMPQLTTVVLPHREMGRWAVEYLLNHRHEPKRRRYPVVKIECPLVERDSVQPAREAGSEPRKAVG